MFHELFGNIRKVFNSRIKKQEFQFLVLIFAQSMELSFFGSSCPVISPKVEVQSRCVTGMPLHSWELVMAGG